MQRATDFLRALLQRLRPVWFFRPGQVKQQKARKQDTSALRVLSSGKKSLKETGTIPALLFDEPVTEPYRAVVRLKRPAERYRALDAMLEEFKRERLNSTETTMLPEPTHRLARQLQAGIEQREEGQR